MKNKILSQNTEITLPPVVDLEHLALFTEGDRNLEKEMIKAFLVSADETAGTLRSLSTLRDLSEAWKRAAHKLAGSASQIGAKRLATTCRTAEVAPDPGPEQKQQLMEDIDCHLQEFRQFFKNRNRT